MKYIDAEKLIAEIERQQEQLRMCCGERVFSGKEKRDMIVAYEEVDRLRTLITSLQQEQPVVDLEKEIEDYAYSLPHSSTGSSAYVSDKRLPIARQFGIKHEWSFDYVEEIARHFYELGLNARKEE
jgi:hypothetical protein